MDTTATPPAAADSSHADHGGHAEPGFWSKYVFSTDHKVIGLQYTLTGLGMALLGVFFSYVIRMNLAHPGQPIPGFGMLTPSMYNVMATNHGIIMIFWVAMPVLLAGFGNYLIPLMIGCDDMVFPRINRLSYQIFFLSTLILIASYFVPGGSFGGGWVSYPPLSRDASFNLAPIGTPMWLLAIILEIVAFLLGGINFITTVMNSRAKGMNMFKIPMIIWMLVIATVLFMISVGPLVAGAIMLFFDQVFHTHFFDPVQGGDPLLWEHLFWFFGHPEVYVLMLPSFGVVCEIIPVFARKPLFGYKVNVYTTFMVAVLSMIVWAHHQFVSGIDPRMATVFSVTTIIISIPVAVMMFTFIATLFGGSIEFSTPMLWSLGMISEFLLGGVTGIYLGSSALDVYFHSSYFVIAHFHYTLIPIVVFSGFAAFYYWFPKVTGRTLNETLGKIHFWGTCIAFNFIFIPLFILGLRGEHRRIFDYHNFPDLATADNLRLRGIATTALLVVIAFQVPFLINLVRSLRKKRHVGPNPWNANTLEWQAPSPPPHGNFAELPVCHRGPYEYSTPGRKDDYWPQNAPN